MSRSTITVSYAQISAAAAERLVQAATTEAKRQGVPVGVAVVDREGMLKAFARMDGAPAVVIEATRAKARAALMGLGSDELGEALREHLPSLLSIGSLEDVSLLGGGLPIVYGDEVVGAIGVGGGNTDQDVAIARHALERLGG